MDLSGLLGSFSLPNTQPATTGLLGQYYDPKEMQRQKRKMGLLNAGIALLSQQPRVGAPYSLGESLGTALRGGMEGAQSAQQDYMNNAQMAYQMNRQARQDARENTEFERKLKIWDDEDQKKQALKDFIAAAPEDQRKLIEAFPEHYGEFAIKKTFPDPVTPTDDQREYAQAQKDGFKGTFMDYMTVMKKAGASNVTVNGGGSDKQIFDAMNESAISARSAAQGLAAVREAKKALPGAITGAFADQRLGLQKVASFLGADPKAVQDTETFRAAIAPQVAAMMKATVGSTQISNADREFAAKAAGGEISLDGGSISRLLDIMERANTALVEQHKQKLDTIYPDSPEYSRERALFGVQSPLEWTDMGNGVKIRKK